MRQHAAQSMSCDKPCQTDKGMTQVGTQHVGKQGRRTHRCAFTRILRLSLQPGRDRRMICCGEACGNGVVNHVE